MNVVVIGTGYVGLTTGVSLAYLGHHVTCLDTNSEKINKLKKAEIPFYEPFLLDLLKLSWENLTFTDSYDEAGIDKSDVVFIAVGTPSKEDGSADMQFVQSAAEQIGQRINCKFTVIVNKSTVPIGSGKWVQSVIRNHYSNEISNGSKPFAVVSNPEFLRQGTAVYDTFFPDRIVIGSDEYNAIERLQNLYRPLLERDFPSLPFWDDNGTKHSVEWLVCDLASAEMIKYSANAFLALKISYINEIAKLASEVGADVKEIARGIGLDKRIGSQFLKAGIGWGGSCFGKDTAALVSIGKEYGIEMPIVSAARKVNYEQRSWIIDKLLSELGNLEGKVIVLLGASFKPNTDDLREAPSIEIAKALLSLGAQVNIVDPVALPNVQRCYPNLKLNYFDNPIDALPNSDAVVLVTEWNQFLRIDWEKAKIIMKSPIIIDGRNVLDREELKDLDFKFFGIGR